jgi:propanol-preferring alcohol dehydrogenase
MPPGGVGTPGLGASIVRALATQLKADIELQPPSAINDVLDRLKRGEASSRPVLEFA